jgi:hypothetical protein
VATVTLETTIERLRTKAQSNPDIARALEFLAEDHESDDPFGDIAPSALAAVRAMNSSRRAQQQAELRRRSLTTSQVVALVGSISDRKAVDRRRQRGRLLGVRDGRTILHPAWQFDRDKGDSRDGLGLVLVALAAVTPNPRHADAIMTTARPDLGGRSVADLFAEGDVALAVRVIATAGDQS